MQYDCGNGCRGKRNLREDEVVEARSLGMRLDPGGEYTDVECKHCGALAYKVPEYDSKQAIWEGICKLREARDLFKQAGATKTLVRVRSAISSAQGARRHAENAEFRAARQAVAS